MLREAWLTARARAGRSNVMGGEDSKRRERRVAESFFSVVSAKVPAISPIFPLAVARQWLYLFQMQWKFHRTGTPVRAALAGILAVLLFVFGLLAANERLHQSLHDGDESASCAVCLFAHGKVDLFGAAPALVSFTVLLFCGLAAYKQFVPVRLAYLSPPGRAPPAHFYNS